MVVKKLNQKMLRVPRGCYFKCTIDFDYMVLQTKAKEDARLYRLQGSVAFVCSLSDLCMKMLTLNFLATSSIKSTSHRTSP